MTVNRGQNELEIREIGEEDKMLLALGRRADGTVVMACGLTPAGLKAMQEEDRVLMVPVPPAMRQVSDMLLFYKPTRAEIVAKFIEAGLPAE